MNYPTMDWAVFIPMANEAEDFEPLIGVLMYVLNQIGSGKVYFVLDNVSKDGTRQLCERLQERDDRFELIWSPENRNVVDAYLKGYKVCLERGHKFIMEMDAGMSHDPRALPMFLRVLSEGNECAFGSRFINGGSTADSAWKRKFLSKFGTTLSNLLLRTKMKDMTSGYQGFQSYVVAEFLKYPLRSKAHFYQTELRYLLRETRHIEVPIHYRAPSPSVSQKAIKNSIDCLLHYWSLSLQGKAPVIEVQFHPELH
jgi:dolichol-phosphate mannosyltransferase